MRIFTKTPCFRSFLFTGTLLTSLALGNVSAWAKPEKGGFTGPGPKTMTVEEVKKLPDDTHVRLQGAIVQHLGGNDYMFKDATGTIPVEIDQKKWRGQEVGDNDTVTIDGEVDVDAKKGIEVDVKHIKKM